MNIAKNLASTLALGLLVGGLASAAPAADKLEVAVVYYPHWHAYPKGFEWFGDQWSQGEWAFVKKPCTRFPGQINFKPLAGYLDGSKPADVETEIALAHNVGIDVFVYDYYWYAGEKTQEEAIEKGFLGAKNRGQMKFALMWCYHERVDAFRSKYGEPKRPLMTLAHTPEEFLGLIDYSIAHYFNQPEYWRKDGKLFFSIYNVPYLWKTWGEDAEKVKNAFAEARRRVRAAGLGELHLNGQGVRPAKTAEMAALGFDSFTDYGFNAYQIKDMGKRYAAGERTFDFAEADGPLQKHWADMRVASPVPYIPVVPTGWDSTLRCRPDQPFPWPAKVDYPYCGTFTNNTDVLFEKYLRDAKAAALNDPKKPGVVYINAWNEYTEGCYLLPDMRRNDLKLRALARVFGRRPADTYVYTGPYHTWEKNPINQPAKSIRTPDLENVKYGPHERQGLDVWFPPASKTGGAAKTPALIVIHGGGWTMGDRIDCATHVRACNEAGIAVVSASYRFIQDANDAGIKPPVKACLDDALAAIRFVQAHADAWHIDVARIGLTGGSAGACSSLYASLQGDNALGIRVVFAHSPQTSIDPQEMKAWIPNSCYGAHAFGYPGFKEWLEHRADCLSWIEAFSPAGLLRRCTASKAPVFLYTCPAPPAAGELPKDPTHASAFCERFEEICRAKGVTCRRGSEQDLIQVLKGGK